MRLQTAVLSLLIAACLSVSSIASAAGLWEKGRHYTELPYPVKTKDPSKIEVVEVFWYGCPHCYEFANDHLPAWEESLPDEATRTLGILTKELPLKKAAALAAEIYSLKKNALYKWGLENLG